MAKKITKKAENTAKKEVETTELTVGVVEPIKEDEINVESVSTEVTSLQEEIKTEIIEEVKSKTDETEMDFIETVNAVTEKIVEEVRKKDDFLKTFEEDTAVKTEEELRDELTKEIERVDNVIKEVQQQNKTPLTTYYWNGTRYDI